MLKWRGKAGHYNPQAHAQVAGPYCFPGKLLDQVFSSNSFILQLMSICNTAASPDLHSEKTGSGETETF